MAPEHFQGRVSEIFSGVKGVVGMTDDVLVFGKNQEYDRLKQTIQAGMTLSREICQFSKDHVSFLGHVLMDQAYTQIQTK